MTPRKKRIYEIIFEAESREGKWFDIVLLIVIFISVLMVLIESVPEYRVIYGTSLRVAEWIITIIFTIEYITRIWVVDKPWKYIKSFYGIIDLLAILPTYLALFLSGIQSLMVIRALRLLRVFRILKLSHYLTESRVIMNALRASRRKISVFLFAVVTIMLIIGTVMYLIEGEKNGFTSIPKSIYWAIVTITTVGYGDIAPQTTIGRMLASFAMILGYSILAVPTGIVTAEFTRAKRKKGTALNACSNCMNDDNDSDAKYCKKCGNLLREKE